MAYQLTNDEIEYLDHLDSIFGNNYGLLLLKGDCTTFNIGINKYFQENYNRLPKRSEV